MFRTIILSFLLIAVSYTAPYIVSPTEPQISTWLSTSLWIILFVFLLGAVDTIIGNLVKD